MLSSVPRAEPVFEGLDALSGIRIMRGLSYHEFEYLSRPLDDSQRLALALTEACCKIGRGKVRGPTSSDLDRAYRRSACEVIRCHCLGCHIMFFHTGG